MTDEIKLQDAGSADKVKLGARSLLVIAGIAGYYLLGSEATWLRWIAVVGRARGRRAACWRSHAMATISASSC